jgi:hypothetical protein
VRTFGPEILAGSNPPSTSAALAGYLRREIAAVQAREASATRRLAAEASSAPARLRPAAVDAALAHVDVRLAAIRPRR